MPEDPTTSETELDASYRRYQEAVQGYYSAASAALLDYTKAMEEAAGQFREAQKEVLELLQKSWARLAYR